MEKKFSWVTPKGAKIDATFWVEHITRKTVDADGWKCEVDADEWFRECTAMTINGKPQAMHNLDNIHKRVVVGRQGRQEIGAVLPADVLEGLYGDERRAAEAKLKCELAAEAAYNAHYERVRKAMSY